MKKGEKLRKVKVSLLFHPTKSQVVGELLWKDGVVYFQYDPNFLQSYVPISPFKLMKTSAPQTPKTLEAAIFQGLYGVFADSLPDGWGLLLMSRAMRRKGISFQACTALDLLSYQKLS